MKKTLMLLAASTALTAAIGAPAWSAIQIPFATSVQPAAAVYSSDTQSDMLILASDDHDDDHGDDHGDDHDDDHGEDDDCDDDNRGVCSGAAANPAPAGTAQPPQNGLFNSGAAPQVQTN